MKADTVQEVTNLKLNPMYFDEGMEYFIDIFIHTTEWKKKFYFFEAIRSFGAT